MRKKTTSQRKNSSRSVCVGPVHEARLADEIISMGADQISFLLQPHPLFAQNQTIEYKSALSIVNSYRRCNTRIKFGIIASPEQNKEDLTTACKSGLFDFIEFDYRFFKKTFFDQSADEVEAEVRISGFSIDEDDDPAWPNQLAASYGKNADSCVLWLLPNAEHPFSWILEEAGEYAEDITIQDLKTILSGTRWLLAADWSSEVRREDFINSLPHNTTLVAYLGDHETPSFFPVLLPIRSLSNALPAIISRK